MRVFKNLFGDGSKINADEVVYKEHMGQIKNLGNRLAYGIANDIAYYDGDRLDPNTTQNFLILTSHENCPFSPGFGFIITLFYANRTTVKRTQIAIGYQDTRLFIRNFNGSTWGNWVEK